MEKTILVLILIFHNVYSVIYRLNDTMYFKMPPVFHIEEYAPCLSEPESVYCTTNFELVSDTPSELLTMIRDYSEHRVKHYNHSKMHYGVCVTKSCKEYYYDENKEGDLRIVLEACLNDTFGKKYELKTKIKDLFCNTPEDKIDIDYADYAVAVICLSLLMINVIGSCYDLLYVRKNRKGNQFLLIFSIQRNCAKLIAPFEMCDPRFKRLIGFNGVRTITTALVITAHSFCRILMPPTTHVMLSLCTTTFFYHTFINGTPIIQVFFLMSAFLLAFNTQMKLDKDQTGWFTVLKRILLRWLRLTPTYSLVLALTCTWLRITWSGPLWHRAVGVEVEDCRRDYWQHLLYINNYFDNTQCMPQTWYLAAEMQLYCLSLVICGLRSSSSRKVTLSLLFIAGVLIPGVVTYAMDLDALLIVSPETSVNYFVTDPTFNNIYKRGHDNLAGYMIGLSMGYLAYHLMTVNFQIGKYKKYLWIYQLLLPAIILITWLGSIFYEDAPKHSLFLRTVCAVIVKPIFTILMAFFILGMIFKCDTIRGVLEWRCWVPTGRLTYCAYVLHVLVIRAYIGSQESLKTSLFLHIVLTCLGTIALTFILATPVWILVESPINQLVKLIFISNTVHMKTKTPVKESKKNEVVKL